MVPRANSSYSRKENRAFFSSIHLKEEIIMTVIIGGAWPYANGSLHLGHLSSLLPGDILARYFRQKGEDVMYVSGSDCNGTPIALRAKAEGKTTKEIADHYHNEFVDTFNALGFTYDCYTRTDSDFHHQAVQDLFMQLLEKDYLYEKTVQQAYCEHDEQFLPDRYVEGECPECGAAARGDQCEVCSTVLSPLELVNPTCVLCGNTPVAKDTTHFYFKLSAFEEQLKELVENAAKDGRWRENAIQLTRRYLKEGLPDRAATRDLPNGIDVPLPGWEGKKIYVWIEAVAGYLTATMRWVEENGGDINDWWNEEAISYYVHGKDNIPFHTVIWPALLMGLGNRALPTHIVSNEYVTLEKQKLSTSRNWAVWVPYMVENYHADSIRYFMTINAPEHRDSDFSWREFIERHNGELLGAYGNFVNRTLKFIDKSFEGKVPEGTIDEQVRERTVALYETVGQKIEEGHLKAALQEVFEYVREANRYFDEQAPWKQVKEEPAAGADTLRTCTYIIANFAQLLQPFLPFSTAKIRDMLSIENIHWSEETDLPMAIQNVEALFDRIDKERIDEEVEKLQSGVVEE